MEISVILPVYNAENYLFEAIESVLNQTFVDFELIIINDGSKDSSLDIINSFKDQRIFLVDQHNKGLAATLNHGLSLAKGKYIARMDADDIALPNRFEIQLNFLKKNPKYKLIGSAVEIIDMHGSCLCVDIPYTGYAFLKKFMNKVGNPFKHPTVMFEKDVALNLGGYNEKIGKYFEDYFLWSKIAEQYKVEILSVVLLKYRITPGSIMGSIKDKEFSDFMKRIIQQKQFLEEDKIEMLRIKNNSENHKMTSDVAYNKRIDSIRSNRMNKLFVILINNTSKVFALKLAILLRKARVFKSVYVDN